MKILRLLAIGLLLVLAISCETTNLAVTPTGDITFIVEDGTGSTSIENARVYLFPSRSAYDTYLADNPSADPGIAPSLSPTNVGTTNSSGRVSFLDYDLEGSNFASGSTFIFDTNPIYYRVEGTVNGTDYLTNDGEDNRLDFGEIESGGSVVLDVEVFIK